MYNLDDKPRKGSGHPARFERRKNPERHVYITGKNSVVPSRIEKSFSPAVYIFHAIFQNHFPLSLSLSLLMSILLYTLERTARIVGSPGPPRVAIRGHRRLQPASKSGSFLRLVLSCGFRRPFFFQLTREKRRARSTTKEKRNRVMYVPRYTMYVGSGREHRRSLQY